jgi:hypothetical protein
LLNKLQVAFLQQFPYFSCLSVFVLTIELQMTKTKLIKFTVKFGLPKGGTGPPEARGPLVFEHRPVMLHMLLDLFKGFQNK